MEYLSREVIKQLMTEQETPAVTIYLPTHRSASPPHMSEDQIRFKNLTHKAIEQLRMRADGEELLGRLRKNLPELLGDQSFWESQTEGLLLCATPGTVRLFHLPLDTEQYVAIDDRFHLAPLLGLLEADQNFYVLLIAQHDPSLFKGDMYGLHPAPIGLPENLESALNLDENNQKSEQGRSAAGSRQNGTGSFNGRGGARNPLEDDRLRFLRMIDHQLIEKADTNLPLILAGVESEIAEYKALTKYPTVLSQTIAGNYSHLHAEELFERAQAIIHHEYVTASHHEALERYERVKGAHPSRVASEMDQAAAAADRGQIDTLLIGMSRYTTDTVRDNVQPVLEISFSQPEETNYFVNNVASRAGNTSSRILNLPQDIMPGGAPLVAILRY